MSPRIKAAMRASNAMLSVLLLVLLLVHAVAGGFVMLGINGSTAKILSWSTLVLAAIHAAFGIIFTVDAVMNSCSGSFKYLKANASFWAVRISGIALLLLLCFHVGAFGTQRSGQFVLFEFTLLRLITHLLMVAALGVHILSALRPMLTAAGLGKGLRISPSLMMFLSVMTLFFAVSVITYYVMWNAWAGV